MSNESHDLAYWIARIESLASDLTDAEQLRELEELLQHNPEARKVYAAWAQLQIDLRMVIRAEEALRAAATDVESEAAKRSGFDLGGQRSGGRYANVQPASRILRDPPISQAHRAAFGWQSLATVAITTVTAVIISVSTLIGLGALPDSKAIAARETGASDFPTFVARLTAMRDVQWTDPRTALRNLSYLHAGTRIDLVSGQVQVTFRDGANVVVKGPACFTPTSRDLCHLEHGRLMARVPSRAMGFAVSTPMGTTVDLGSEFGVAADLEGVTEVHVLSGEVEFVPKSKQNGEAPSAERIVAEQGRRIGANGFVEVIAADASLFIHSLQTPVEINGVAAIPVMPPPPVSGYLYDETYAKVGDPVTDGYGESHGSLVAVGRGQRPMNSSDSPFKYAGNRSIDTTSGNSGADFPIGSFSTALNGSPAITIQAWFKYQDDVLSSGGPFNNRIAVIHINGDIAAIMVGVNDTNTISLGGRSQPTDKLQSITTTATLVPGQWNHIVGILDFSNKQIHVSINGGAFETGSAEFNSKALIPGKPTRQDRIPSSPFYSIRGRLDEVAIWNTALTADHIAWLNQNSLHRIPKAQALPLPSDRQAAAE